MQSARIVQVRVTVAVVAAVTLAAILPSPAAAWSLQSLRTGVYRIERSPSDATGTVNIYRTSEGMNTHLTDGTWDNTSGPDPSYSWVVGVKFDNDDLAVELSAPASVMSYFYLVCFPNGQSAASLVSMVSPVSLQTSQGVAIERLPVSLSELPTASVTGTVGVSGVASVSVVGTVSTSEMASLSIDGTLPVDPWGSAGLPASGATFVFALGSALAGMGMSRLLVAV